MRRTLLAAPLALALVPTLANGAPRQTDKPVKERTKKMAFELTSPAFKNNERIPQKHTGEGEDASPALAWADVPAGTESFALVMDDPDAPVGLWLHWVLFDIPAGLKGLPEGVTKKESLPDGSKHGKCWGTEKMGYERAGYYGPMPPPGKPHRYVFKLYALDQKLGLPAKADKNDILRAMKGHILGEAQLIGIYER
ncbi:MAG: YbhB/YbcL family Raf kinase inhibitor-like protein [Elusimicrobia bacterium]|nr:YbhB/YbcL family Raf kinase inhibitor-like protein [Elusimicrobiota bacterium]